MRGLALGALAVACGFLATCGFTVVAFGAAGFLLGAEFVLQPGSSDSSAGWMQLSAALGTLAAGVGGFVCGALAKGPAPVRALAALLVAIGAAYAATVLSADGVMTAAGREDWIEAQLGVRSPAWFLVALPLLDAAGVVLGAGLARRCRGAPVRSPAAAGAVESG